MGRVQKEAFWLYGVIVGLAVREALVATVPHLALKQAPAEMVPWKIHLEGWRLVVFLALIIRFYLGAAAFFDSVYDNEATAKTIANKNYSLDYTMGFVNFLMFFAWSSTIPIHDRLLLGTSPYLLFLSAIILYDLVWLAASWNYGTVKVVKVWAVWNAITFLVCGFLFLVVEGVWGNAVLAEEVAFPFLLLISAIEIIELTRGKQYLMGLARQFFE